MHATDVRQGSQWPMSVRGGVGVGAPLIFTSGLVPHKPLLLVNQRLPIVVLRSFATRKSSSVQDGYHASNILRGRLLKRLKLVEREVLTGEKPLPEVFEVELGRIVLEVFVIVETLPPSLQHPQQTTFDKSVLLSLGDKEPFIDLLVIIRSRALRCLVLLKEKQSQSIAHRTIKFALLLSIIRIENTPQSVVGQSFEKQREILDRTADAAVDSIPFLTYTGFLILVPITQQELAVASGKTASGAALVRVQGHVYRLCIIPSLMAGILPPQQHPYSHSVSIVVDISDIVYRNYYNDGGGRREQRMSSADSHDDGGWKAAWESGENIDYSSIGIPTEQRDQLRELKRQMGFETYALLIDEIIKNTQEDLSSQ